PDQPPTNFQPHPLSDGDSQGERSPSRRQVQQPGRRRGRVRCARTERSVCGQARGGTTSKPPPTAAPPPTSCSPVSAPSSGVFYPPSPTTNEHTCWTCSPRSSPGQPMSPPAPPNPPRPAHPARSPPAKTPSQVPPPIPGTVTAAPQCHH